MSKQKYVSRYYGEDVYLDDRELKNLLDRYVMLCKEEDQEPVVTVEDFEIVKSDQRVFEEVYFIVTEEELGN